MKFRVLSIDSWADMQACPHCGSNNIMEQVSKSGMRCSSCLEVFNEDEGISWSWNNWFTFGEYDEERDGELNEVNAFKFFSDYINPGHEAEFEIEDDQYNFVLVRKSNGKPFFAIEYGNKY